MKKRVIKSKSNISAKIKERWKTITGQPDYEVSNHGRVKSHKYNRELIMKTTSDKDGYQLIILTKEGKQTTHKVHRLVATHFLKKKNPLLTEVNHENGIKDFNYVKNLKWCTHKENMRWAFDTGLIVARKGEEASNVKLKKKQVLKMRADYATGNFTYRTLGIKYKISNVAAFRAVTYRSWKE